MTREEARTVAERLLASPQVLCWTETSAHHPLWSAGDETRVVEVRWMKSGGYLRKRVLRTRTSDPTPVTWETHHRPDWLAMTLAVPFLEAHQLSWLGRGQIVVQSSLPALPDDNRRVPTKSDTRKRRKVNQVNGLT